MNDAPSFRIGSWTVTPSLNLLECGTRSLRIEPRAMDVLAVLARSTGTVVSIDQLMSSVWSDAIVGDGSAYLAIRQLRQALGEAGDGLRYIETIPKRGYRLTVPVEPCDSAQGRSHEAPAPAAAASVPADGAHMASQEKLSMAYWAAFHHEPDLALELLADAAPSMRHSGLLWQPLFREPRSRPAFKAVVARLGMVDYWRA